MVCGSFSEPVFTQKSWRQMCSTPGPTLITAGKLQNCNGVDESGKKKRRRKKIKCSYLLQAVVLHVPVSTCKSGYSLSNIFQQFLKAKIAFGLWEAALS